MNLRLCLVLALLPAVLTATVIQSGIGASAAEQYVPQLGEIMNAAQVRHEKLYLAGKALNWRLAAYQSRQIRGNLRDAAVFYAGIPIDNVTTLAELLNGVDSAIEAKSSQRFSKAFDELTSGCNGCHKSMDRAFIVMKRPSNATFGNQEFRPTGER